jgi:hypothetical protein
VNYVMPKSSWAIPKTVFIFSCVLLLFFASTQTPTVTSQAAPINTGDTAIWDYLPGNYVAPLRTDAIRITVLSQNDQTTNLEIAIWTASATWARYNTSSSTNQTTVLWFTHTPSIGDTINDLIYQSTPLITNTQNITDPTTGQDALLVTAGTPRSSWHITYDLSSRFTIHIEAHVTICCGQIDSYYTLHNSTIDIGAPSAPPSPTPLPTTPLMLTILFIVILIPTIIAIAFLFRRYKQNTNQ